VESQSSMRANFQLAVSGSQGCVMRASQLVERLSLVDSGDPQSEQSFSLRAFGFSVLLRVRDGMERVQLRTLTRHRPVQLSSNDPRGVQKQTTSSWNRLQLFLSTHHFRFREGLEFHRRSTRAGGRRLTDCDQP